MLVGYEESVATKEWSEVVFEVAAGANQTGDCLEIWEFRWSSYTERRHDVIVDL